MRSFEVRPAMHPDLDALRVLWEEVMEERAMMDKRVRISQDAPQLWQSQVQAWIDDPNVKVLVAERNNKLIAFVIGMILERPMFYYQQRYGYIADLAVDGHAHVGGLGTALLNALKPWFIEQGIHVLEAPVMRLHPMAQAFWRAKGASEFIDHFWYRLK